jgi:hypothetical protein
VSQLYTKEKIELTRRPGRVKVQTTARTGPVLPTEDGTIVKREVTTHFLLSETFLVRLAALRRLVLMLWTAPPPA